MGTKEISWDQVKAWDQRYSLHPFLTPEEVAYGLRCVERVEEHFICLADGTKMLDLMSGCMSCSGGLSHPKVAAAIKDAADDFGFIGEMNPTRHKAEACKILMEDILGPESWAGACRWTSSGSEATEIALQIATLYTNRPNIITREWAYHGWTLGAGACTRLRPVADTLTSTSEPVSVRDVPGKPGGFYVVPGHNCYRCSLGHTYPNCKMRDGRLPCVNVVESMIRAIGVNTVAAIITETAYGTAAIAPAEEYCSQIRQMTKKLGILWIDDEVLTGCGRVGAWFGYERYGQGATPDIMTIGKGVVSSQLPVGGVVVSKEIAEFLGRHRWALGVTYFAHPLAMAAVVANLKRLIEEKVVENAAKVGGYFGDRLRALQAKHKSVGLVSGSGCLWFIELVRNRETREPFVKEDRSADLGDMSQWPTSAVYARMARKGVLAGGMVPNTVTLVPSCSITRELIDMACEAVDDGLTAADEMCDG